MRIIRSSLILLALPFATLPAQTNDAARTLLGISFGVLPGRNLWQVTDQTVLPISAPPGNSGITYGPDIWSLKRDLVSLRPTIRIDGTHFVTPHLGYTAEIAYYAFKTIDACTVVQHGTAAHPGDPNLPGICDSIPTTLQGGGGSFAAQGGVVLRPWSGSVIQPYFEALGGIVSTPNSTAAVVSTFEGAPYTVFRDPSWRNTEPTWVLAAGIATDVVRGLQGRVEARYSWVVQDVVTGAASTDARDIPSVSHAPQGTFFVLVGFDIVLGTQRGKRY